MQAGNAYHHPRTIMSDYHPAPADDHPHHEWAPSLPSLSLSATYGSLESHHHSQSHHHGSHGHPHHSSHVITYPSQHLNSALAEHVAPMMESPSYSQDRESLHSEHDDESAAHTPMGSIPPLPSYQLSMCPLPGQQSFKRPYQPDQITPATSPQPSQKRRKSTSKEIWTMSPDDELLLQLKDEEGLPWKTIAIKFKEAGRGDFRVPTLQMRYKRLREKLRVWEPEDILALKEAKEYVEKNKWELISQRMCANGNNKRKIPGSTCEKKWKEMFALPEAINTQNLGCGGPNSACTDSAISLTNDGFLQACDMKRELSQLSEESYIKEEHNDGLGLSIDGKD